MGRVFSQAIQASQGMPYRSCRRCRDHMCLAELEPAAVGLEARSFSSARCRLMAVHAASARFACPAMPGSDGTFRGVRARTEHARDHPADHDRPSSLTSGRKFGRQPRLQPSRTTTHMRLELHGWSFRQPQNRSSRGPTWEGWPCVTMLRSRSTVMEPVTGECHRSKRRDLGRSTASCFSKLRRQKSP